MIVSINQPAFLPWLGYFNRIAASDLHIVLDHVQFEKNSLTNRNRIRNIDSEHWLSVPINTSGKFGNLQISELEIANQIKWQKKIIETIKQFYRKSPYFDLYFPFIEHAIAKERVNLKELIIELNSYFLKLLDINTPMIYSSEIKIEGKKSDLVLNLCKKYNAKLYLSGIMGKEYLVEESFKQNGIKIIYDQFQFPNYSQIYPNFIPNLSIIDTLFNMGDKTKELLNNFPQKAVL